MAPAVQLFQYQQDWLRDQARFKIGMFARQTGKTFTTGLELVDDCYTAEAARQRTRWVILSRGERQAKEAMDESVAKHAKAYGMASLAVTESEFVGEDKTRYAQFDIVLPGGSKISALPANPDTARGYSANVFLDEFAFHAKSREIWGALFPVISKPGLKLRVTSTPNGKGNKFYELMTSEKLASVWSRHLVDIHRAVADGLPRDIELLRAGIGDSDLWDQEYELQWLDEASSWLSYELINDAESDRAGKPALFTGGRTFIGVDIGRRKDLFVICIFELVGDVLWEREMIIRKRITFAEQDFLLDDAIRRYRPSAVWMDQTGMGEKPVEDAQRRWGESLVTGVLFTVQSKLALATVAKQKYEDHRIRIRMGDDLLRSDLHSLKKVSSATGAPIFQADESETDGHADRAWAQFLAISAASNPYPQIEFHATTDKLDRYATNDYDRDDAGSIKYSSGGF